jgi:hypothetical protein
MSRFILVIFIIIFLLAVGATIFFIWEREEKVPEILTPKITPEIPADWKTYSNTKYNYSFNYPGNYQIGGGDNYDWWTGFEKAPRIHIFSHRIDLFNVQVQDPEAFLIAPEILEEKVEDWAERFRQINLHDNNPNFPNKKVGNLQHIILSGQDGYKFTLTDSFADGRGGGYLLPPEQVYVYIFVADSKGIKFIIWYPEANSDSQKILDSFKFLETTP